MPDELDPLLLRVFAQRGRPVPDGEFVARIAAQLRPPGSLPGIARALPGATAAVLRGLATGVAAPLRLRYAGLVALGALGVALWSILKSSV